MALVADTHSRIDARGLELLSALKPEHILHAGDIGDLDVLEALAAIAPTTAVRGNIDSAAEGLPASRVIALEVGGALGLRVFLTHIGVAGPRVQTEVAAQAKEAGASLVVCGHSHVPFLTQQRGLTVFNPGSIGPRRFTLPIVFGALSIDAATASLRHIDCETGRTWLPPG